MLSRDRVDWRLELTENRLAFLHLIVQALVGHIAGDDDEVGLRIHRVDLRNRIDELFVKDVIHRAVEVRVADDGKAEGRLSGVRDAD